MPALKVCDEGKSLLNEKKKSVNAKDLVKREVMELKSLLLQYN